MITQKITLKDEKFFSEDYQIPKSKLIRAVGDACSKLESQIPMYKDLFPATSSKNFKYPLGPNNNWECGMFTGVFWLAYELTGCKKFRDVALSHIPTYRERIDNKIGMDDHDVGFVFSPSCVAAYKVTGDESVRNIALDAAEYFYNTSYSQKGGFVIRMSREMHNPPGCRTMMDTLMNVPLLFWAGQETGNQKYTDAAVSQNKITAKYLIRDDASSFHHYQFDVNTHKPLHGLTFQGYSNESCWSRGHAWGVYGFPVAYAYTEDDYLVNLHRDITYYMLNNLPDSLIPYWDFVFTSGAEPLDSSAGAIAVCGMNEMCRHLPDDAPQKKIYKNAQARMLEAIIDLCTGDIGREYDGLIYHVTGSKRHNAGVDECAVYGDYHYLEALCRFMNPDWERYW